jgi:hypothetical protein
MKVRHFTVFVLAIGLALLLIWSVAAQGPEPPIHQQRNGPPQLPSEWDGDRPFPRPTMPGAGMGVQGVNAAAAGAPGLAFRYVKTFGVTEQAYIADVQHLNFPTGLFIDGSDNLYVAEEWGQRVLKYRTSDGANMLSIGTAGLIETSENTFNDPKDVAVDSSGNIWVVDNHRVTQYDASGNFLQVFPDWDKDPWTSGDDNEHFDLPIGIAFDSAGRLYVSDLNNHRVQVYTFVGGSPVYSTTIGETGVAGSDNSHFDSPQRIIMDTSDRLYVADVGNYRIQRCTYVAGWTCTTFHGTGSQGSSPNELGWLAPGLGIDSSDNIYIADLGNGRVKKCPPDSSGGGSCPTFASGFDWPTDVAVDSTNNVYVSDLKDSTITKFNSSGSLMGTFVGISGVPYLTDNSHFNTPNGVAVDGNGNIYLSTNRGYRALKLNASGTAQWAAGIAGVWGGDNLHFGDLWDGPNNLAVDSSGKVYVADTGNHRIQIYNSSGSYLATLGSYGSGNYQFDRPCGVAVDSNSNIYVADTNNHRVQIYNSSRVYVATVGVTGVSGSDNSHFDGPYGVAVDSNGNIYVADAWNRRVQVFNSSRAYVRTLGITDEWGEDFAHFSEPRDVAVDVQGRVYVADAWNNRVQVFDSSGVYLTTIGGAWGSSSGQFRNAMAVDVDAQGNVYVADENNARIQKFAPGVPGWFQVNVNGFGDADNWGVLALEAFDGQLYTGTGANSSGADLWRAASPWAPVMTNGFGTTNNIGIDDLIEFKGYLYAGLWNDTTGGEIHRSSNGTNWTEIEADGLGNANNSEVFRFAIFNNQLYAATYNPTDGSELWRSSSGNNGSWSKVVDGGFGDASNILLVSLAEFNGYLYVGTENSDIGAEVWRSSTGNSASWLQVNSGGFGDSDNWSVTLEPFGGYLYAGTYTWNDGAEIWRCATCDGTDWTQAASGGFGNPDNRGVPSLIVFDGQLYAVTRNRPTGMEVWHSANGTDWEVATAGMFANTTEPYWDNSVTVFDNGLYVGASYPWGNAGGKVWLMTKQAYLPVILKNN